MKILILGGAGFVGSNLVKKLSEDKNNQVAVIDNLSTGSEENMVNSATYIKAETEEIDYILKERLCFTPDIIYHLGEYSRVLTSFEDIDDVVDFNVKGTLAVIEYCLGISEEFTILEVAKMFGGPIEMQNKQRGDRNFSLIDLTNIEKLGWKAEKSLADYISTNKNI